MKKQILFLTLFTLAIIASTSNVFGQLTPRDIDCAVTAGPLNPILGKTYDYSILVNESDFSGGVTYNWRVTQAQTFITGGSFVAAIEADASIMNVDGGTYNAATASNATISLSWNTGTTNAAPFFVTVAAVGDNGICSPDNFKVYKIVPSNNFTLDIANVNDAGTVQALSIDGTTPAVSECIDEVQSVAWSVGTENALYDYGSNELVWAVTAANWATSWAPTLNISGVNASELIESVEWNTASDFTGTGAAFTGGSGDGVTNWTTATPVAAVAGSGYVGTAGEEIYIRVILDHTDDATTTFFEGLVDQNIVLAIDGVTANGDPDVHFTGGAPLCQLPDGFTNDLAQQNVLRRPTITKTIPDPDQLLNPIIQP